MIGEKIRHARLAQQRSLADVAAKADLSVATLSRIENEKQNLDVSTLLLLSRVLELDPKDLVASEEDKNKKDDPLAQRIVSLDGRQRAQLWRDLATERRTRRGTRRGGDDQQLAAHVDELLAQLDFVRQELESVRNRVHKPKRKTQ